MSKIIDKIALLLAKAERAATKEEARAYNDKAEELILRHGIEEAAVQAKMRGDAKPADPMGYKIIKITGTYNRAELSIAHSVASGLGTVTAMQNISGGVSSCLLYLFGYESDREACEFLWRSLKRQAMTEVNRWAATNAEFKALRPHEKVREKITFMESFGFEVERRLREIRNQVVKDMEKEGTVGAEVALIDKRKQATEYAYQAFTVKNGRFSHRKSGGYGAVVAGRQAGNRADIGQSAVRR